VDENQSRSIGCVHDQSAPTGVPGMSECTIKDVYLLTRMMNCIRLIHHIRVSPITWIRSYFTP